eukprot:maker-scaffold1216_size55193-snap-gene-0.10 protein:Tk10891 transcript:maker-scaffold1216_size55193-snap-gene-0.10-mRNA-1 annotation:"glycoside hydrolase family 18 protein"
MRRISLFLVAILPICLTSIIPDNTDAQGNKKHLESVKVSVYSNHGACTPHVKEWDAWEGGFLAKIQVSDIKSIDWKVQFELDKAVELLEVFEGQADQSAGQQFLVTAKDCEADLFAMVGKFPKNSVTPLLKSIKINEEETIQCQEAANPGETPAKEVDSEEASASSEVAAATSGHVDLPKKILGLYILLADDDEEGFESNAQWEPALYPWQQISANVLFFTFIHPTTMEIPQSFQKLAATRGTDKEGAVPKDTTIIFAIGGFAYSMKPNPWEWLTSKDKAEAMAERVAKWYDDYNCDGIDLDLEDGAGSRPEAGPNMIHFIKKLRQLQPKMVVSQPAYGYPQVQAEIDVINAGYDTEGNGNGLIDLVGLMVYESTLALTYVKNYAQGSEQWEGFPIEVNVPTSEILLGAKGSATPLTTITLAKEAVSRDLRGIMVWYASVKNGFKYSPSWDWTENSAAGYVEARRVFDEHILLVSHGLIVLSQIRSVIFEGQIHHLQHGRSAVVHSCVHMAQAQHSQHDTQSHGEEHQSVEGSQANHQGHHRGKRLEDVAIDEEEG